MAMKLIVTAPFECRHLSNEDHMLDGEMELHSIPDTAIKVPEDEGDRYVTWEYAEIGRRMNSPFKRCQQQLIQDDEQKPVFSMDRIVVRDIHAQHHVFYFDVTVPIQKERERYDKAWEDHLMGKQVDPQIAVDFEKAADVKLGHSRMVRLRPNENYFGKPQIGGERPSE